MLNGDPFNHPTRRVPGLDLTWSAPKSVSVLYALGDPTIQKIVVDACEHAVTEAISWLEREACFVRRGSNNRHTRNLALDCPELSYKLRRATTEAGHLGDC